MNTSTLEYQDLVFNFHETIHPHDVKLIYEGEINHNIMKVFTSLTEKELRNESFPNHKKVFGVMVECLQNISKHSYKIGDNHEGIFQIGYDNNKFHIGTGNFIANNEIENLRSQLDMVNSKTRDELNELYRTYLREGKMTKTGSAGLGLIDLARETDDKIKYEFTKENDDYSFFSLTVNF